MVSFQLRVNKMMMLDMIIIEFLIIKVRLLLTADFAWLTSELSRLINSPDLCSSKKYMSFEINFVNSWTNLTFGLFPTSGKTYVRIPPHRI